ncbi:MAG: Rrf2 family transcriptional regulator [Actinomycetes bacterium]|jgi:DNA-binding IscR family transcriptional regulator|nr:MAG: hypothetical protein DIU67_11535 [Actinomycetota bacterium]
MRSNLPGRTDLALAVLLELWKAHGQRLQRDQLAERVGATPGSLAQVMPFLVAEGWVQPERGGGYRLADPDARVVDVYRVVEGRAVHTACVPPAADPAACHCRLVEDVAPA